MSVTENTEILDQLEEIKGIGNLKDLEQLESIIKKISGDYGMLNRIEIFFKGRRLVYHNGQILLLPKGKDYNKIDGYKKVKGKEIFLFKNGTKSTVLNDKNEWDILDINQSDNLMIHSIELKTGFIVFNLKDRYNRIKTFILSENNKLNKIPFNNCGELKKIYSVGDKYIFVGKNSSLKHDPFPVLDKGNEWTDFTGPEEAQELKLAKEVNGKEIFLYGRDLFMDDLLLVDDKQVELPEGVGNLHDVTINNGNLIFLFWNNKSTSEKFHTGLAYILDSNNKWSKAIDYPKETQYISKIFVFEGKSIIYFMGKGILANIENNQWNILFQYTHDNHSYTPTIKKFESNGKSYITISTTRTIELKRVSIANDNIELGTSIYFDSSVLNIKNFNGYNVIETYCGKNYILNNDDNIVVFEIDGQKHRSYEEIKSGNKTIYSFQINGTTKLLNGEEFRITLDKAIDTTTETRDKIDDILENKIPF